MILQAEVMASAALMRKESRGAHYRLDFPAENNGEYLVNTLCQMKGDDLALKQVPVQLDPDITPDNQTSADIDDASAPH